MTDQLNCQLSAFVDDALSAEESELLVRRLCRDPGLRDTMARYALIGDAVRGGKPAAPAEFSRRIMMAVEGQPMPAPAAVATRRHPGRQFGFAVAASVALAAVALMTLPGRAPGPDGAPAQVAEADNALAPAPAPVSPVNTFASPVPTLAAEPRPPDTDARLNNYLVQHVSATGARRGAIAYRNVGFVSETEPRR